MIAVAQGALGALGASVAATLDVLSVADRAAKTLGRAPVHWQVISAGSLVPLSNGLQIAAQSLDSAAVPVGSVLVLPGLGLDHCALGPDLQVGIQARYDAQKVLQRMALPDSQQYASLAAAHRASGGSVAASCSGVVLLAMAGLLDGQEATTHWRLAGFFKRHFPRTRLNTQRMVVDAKGLVTAGAAMAQLDLMLYLIRQHVGHDVAELAMRYLLIDTRTAQARYQVWDHLDVGSDDTAQRFEALVEGSLPNVPTIAQAARQLHLSEKTFARRILKTTGLTPMALVHGVRMRHAERLLALGDLPLEEVAHRLGYANATSLRKLTLKMAQLPPGALRPKPAH